MTADAYQRRDILRLQNIEGLVGIFVELLSYPSCFFFDSSGTGSGVATWSFASRSKDLSFKFVVYQGLVRNLSPLEDGCYGLGCNLYFL